MSKQVDSNLVNGIKIRRRKLPHFELPGSIYFVTFTTTEGIRLSEPAKKIVFESIKFHAGKKYDLHACVVMDTHAHVILKPLNVQAGTPVLPVSRRESSNEAAFLYTLAEIMHSIKSYSANRIQKLLKINGSVWLDENYDRVIRDDAEYSEKFNYIVNNPVKAGLVERPEDYKWLYLNGMN